MGVEFYHDIKSSVNEKFVSTNTYTLLEIEGILKVVSSEFSELFMYIFFPVDGGKFWIAFGLQIRRKNCKHFGINF